MKRGCARTVFNIFSAFREINIMDNMISMMEKYTDHLEEVVQERTQQLEEEKLKTDALLYRMLPRYRPLGVLCVHKSLTKYAII